MPAAVVTGAASGIGRAPALRLADQGYTVHLADIASTEELAEETGGISAPTDVTFSDQMARLANQSGRGGPGLPERWNSGDLVRCSLGGDSGGMDRHDRKTFTAEAVLHDAGPAVGLSNAWSNDQAFDWGGLHGALSVVQPERPLVDYAADDAALFMTAGFEPLGPQRVREQ